MIRYALRCERGHAFESWFASAEAYDRLAEAKALACAVCGTGGVSKSLMAPSVAASAERPEPARDAPPTPPDPGAPRPPAPPAGPPVAAGTRPAPVLSAPAHPLEVAIRALRAHVEANAQHVGRAFAEIARDMHEGVEEARPVYGEATAEEARALLEDGVPVLPLPWPTRRDS